MKKRLRKKKHLGEFKELGFELSADLQTNDCDCDAVEPFVDRLLVVVDARKLAIGGGTTGDEKFEVFVTCWGAGSTTEHDRAALAAFLEGDPAVVRHEIGALKDAWR